LIRHPEALRTLPDARKGLVPPRSFATCPYYALHAFRFVNGAGDGLYVRYTLVPEAGEQRISTAEGKRLGRDYLHEEIQERLKAGPVRFTLELQIADPGDPTDDPSAVWPQQRRRVTAGTLELTGLDTER